MKNLIRQSCMCALVVLFASAAYSEVKVYDLLRAGFEVTDTPSLSGPIPCGALLSDGYGPD
jgi:hypothetical protein